MSNASVVLRKRSFRQKPPLYSTGTLPPESQAHARLQLQSLRGIAGSYSDSPPSLATPLAARACRPAAVAVTRAASSLSPLAATARQTRAAHLAIRTATSRAPSCRCQKRRGTESRSRLDGACCKPSHGLLRGRDGNLAQWAGAKFHVVDGSPGVVVAVGEGALDAFGFCKFVK